MPHDKRLSKAAGAFADIVSAVFLVVVILCFERVLPWIVGVFQ